MLSPLLVGPILRWKCLCAQCISNTTRVCLKALAKHFFLLGNLQLKIKWQALPERGEKVETSNLELWDNRQFPECPVQLCTHANQVPPGTIWTGDVPQTWLEEPDIPEEQRVATAINHKLHLGQ